MKVFSIHQLFAGLLAFGMAQAASAHEDSGTLGPEPGATDYFTISCFDDGGGAPDHLFFELKAGPPATGPIVSAQIQVPDKQIASNVTDPINGDLGNSRQVKVTGGTSLYHVTVNKSGAGKATYFYVYHCEANGGVHTGTDSNSRQNQ